MATHPLSPPSGSIALRKTAMPGPKASTGTPTESQRATNSYDPDDDKGRPIQLVGPNDSLDWCELTDLIWLRVAGRGDSLHQTYSLAHVSLGTRVNAHYRARTEPCKGLSAQDSYPANYTEHKCWREVLTFIFPGILPTWRQGGPSTRGPNSNPRNLPTPTFGPFYYMPHMHRTAYPVEEEWHGGVSGVPVRMMKATPAWELLSSLRGTINLFRQENPTLSPTTGAYSHWRRRGWDRDRRFLARVMFLPGVHKAWTAWVTECIPLLRLRAVSPEFNQAVQNAEIKGGDVLATLVAGQWLNFIALVISDLEFDMWDRWNKTQAQHHMGLWEWENDVYNGTMWDEYDKVHGFPADEDPGSLEGRLEGEKQRRISKFSSRRHKDTGRSSALEGPPTPNRVCRAPLPYPGIPGTDREWRRPVPKAPPPLPLHMQTRPLPPPGLEGPHPINYYASPCNMSVASSDTDDLYVNQLAAMAEEAEAEATMAEEAEAEGLRHAFDEDSHTDMDPEPQNDYFDDGSTAALYDVMADYPGNWPGGTP